MEGDGPLDPNAQIYHHINLFTRLFQSYFYQLIYYSYGASKIFFLPNLEGGAYSQSSMITANILTAKISLTYSEDDLVPKMPYQVSSNS